MDAEIEVVDARRVQRILARVTEETAARHRKAIGAALAEAMVAQVARQRIVASVAGASVNKTCARATTAPDASRTVPLTAALPSVAWANIAFEANKANINTWKWFT